MKNKMSFFATVIACLMVGVGCQNDEDDKRGLAAVDQKFVQDVARANLTEIEFGVIAAAKGESEMVRAYGQQMVNEHTTAQNELRQIANDYNNVDWPNGLDAQHQQMRNALTNVSGYSFDSLYMNSQVMDHQMTLDVFEQEMTAGTEQKVKAYSEKYYPHIQHHYAKADSILSVLLANPDTD
jgi:putative membrane protein